ncbi:rhamnosyl transferase [Aureococcus anophagefferens]|nr:rhamnosyl transferase [Aureococcus anophagefferens]
MRSCPARSSRWRRLFLLPIAAATFDAARWLGGECGQPPGRSVIVVETRFMQGQGRFRALVGARLEQMLAVTVPSMAAQTNRCFVWLVSTDPALRGPRARRGGARRTRCSPTRRGVDATYAPGKNVTSLLATAFPGLRARLAAADELTLVTLDADDALHRSYVQHVARWRRSAPPLSAAATFDYACANRAMAWLSSKDVGARAGRADAEVRQQHHAVYLETLPRGCLMSGLAHALALVGGDLRACAPAPCPVLAAGHKTATADDAHGVEIDAGGDFDPGDVATAPVLRVRSVTSTGGKHPRNVSKLRRPASSRRIASAFGIKAEDLVSLTRYLQRHEAAVAGRWSATRPPRAATTRSSGAASKNASPSRSRSSRGTPACATAC